jgi:hypothetical protein
MMGMQLVLDGDAAKGFVENAQRYFDLDAAEEGEFKEGLRRLAALQYAMEDILRAAGVITEPMTDLASRARTNNPFYVPTLAKAGDNP